MINLLQCPITLDILSSIKDVFYHPKGLAYFSVLAPKVSVDAHSGSHPERIRVHLGLEVPSDCFISVDNEIRTWEEGKCIVFDDSFEHKVWNDSNSDRSVLLFDVWHPDLTEEEKFILYKNKIEPSIHRKGWVRK